MYTAIRCLPLSSRGTVTASETAEKDKMPSTETTSFKKRKKKSIQITSISLTDDGNYLRLHT
jgi:hypothetical protein